MTAVKNGYTDSTKDWTAYPWLINAVESPCPTSWLEMDSLFSIKAASALFTGER